MKGRTGQRWKEIAIDLSRKPTARSAPISTSSASSRPRSWRWPSAPAASHRRPAAEGPRDADPEAGRQEGDHGPNRRAAGDHPVSGQPSDAVRRRSAHIEVASTNDLSVLELSRGRDEGRGDPAEGEQGRCARRMAPGGSNLDAAGQIAGLDSDPPSSSTA
jgi:hypothetical protein